MLQSICLNSNIYYRFPTSCNTSTYNGYHPLHYIVTALIRASLFNNISTQL